MTESTEQVVPITISSPEDEYHDQELNDISNLISDELYTSSEPPTDPCPKPFAAFGSYRQRHGDAENNIKVSSEAPAKLFSQQEKSEGEAPKSHPVNIPRSGKKKGLRPRNWSREAEREEAWERKKDQHLLEELKQMEENRKARAVGRSVSDCGERNLPRLDSGRSRLRARSLTDEDLDELRGSIDLGFGFSNQADPELWNTLPALELCYAINQQYQNKGASPVSTVDDDGTLSEGSPMNSPSWTISSPGDHPQQVKTRLRHWAQAVACTIRQNYHQELY